ncbi:MAG: bifunctional homocysteine S-methyltransferase/methylenetetrahydrofolate reductase [Chloroflexota bacterium]
MCASKFLSRLQKAPTPLLSDGAMGTLLHVQGIGFDACLDALNLEKPASIADVHRRYIDAGADIIQTNTFGANRYKLAAHGLHDQVAAINQAGVELAQRVIAAAFKEVFIAGDIGPLGVRLAPFGRVRPAEARAAFSEQIAALLAAGVDLVLFETFTDLRELQEAITAARQLAGAEQVALVASMAFTRDDRTLLGDSPARVAGALWETGADVIGANCSGGPAQIARIIRQMRQAAPQAYFSAMPNAGWPEQIGGRIAYPANPAYFGEYASVFRQSGVNVIGGCCGTTPAHTAVMRAALDRQPQASTPETAQPLPAAPTGENTADEGSSRLAQKLVGQKDGKAPFVVAVEMDPPRGLATHKLLAGASLLAEAGADVINIADSPMARMRMSPWAVCEIVQRQLPIETVLHFPTRGRNLLRVQGDLLAAHALGIRNVFVVMGDPTAIGDYPDAMDNYDLVPSGLIKLIKQSFNAGRDHAGSTIGQPTRFFVGGALNLTAQDTEREIKNLRRKVKAGVDFLLTQPVYQPEAAATFLQRYETLHGPLDVPVLAGVMPLYGVRHATFLHNEVPGISISSDILRRLEGAGNAAPHEGVKIALETIEQMRPWVRGVYVMPQFGRYDLAAEIVEELSS